MFLFEGEKLRFVTSGFMRLLVMRRSPASGILCRIAEAPMRNAAIAAESQLFRWPGVKELLNSFNTNNAVLDSSPWKREQEKRQKKKKAGADLGARR